jgi:SAM-dependent methyltransferase
MTAEAPPIDLDWLVDEDMPPGPYPRDSAFVFRRVPQLITQVATAGAPQRVLDVACGFGGQVELLRGGAREAWGLDASLALLRHCRTRFAADPAVPLVAAAAEALPFRSGSFDRIVCQGSLDHFARPRAFLREAARVLQPDGRLVIGISNYDSLSCRLGRGLYALRDRAGLPVYRGRNYWDIPPNHTFRGTYGLLRRLGGPHLELVGCRGISLLWLFNRWTRLVEALPAPLAWSALRVLDRVAYRLPALADLVVSVWRPRTANDG